ncbi:MAG: NAD(P)/FAD-dependent oxidoreductase [Clostridia bacterium]|nr:NAD(P)/FAD-dependent oxidoreductase [Clostridia bacterium]
MRKIVVIGGGPAGLISAYSASKNQNQVILLEKNEKLGKKIYITGKGRCNLTNDVLPNEFFPNVVSNPKFIYSAINVFSPKDVFDFFEENGLQLKVERGNRVFPLSDKASDVTKTLEKALFKANVDVRLNTEVKKILVENGQVKGVETNFGEILCDSVIVCTGGISYPLTGSTGDGYKFAKSVGHNVVELKPSLVGIELCGNEFIEVQGLSLKNVTFTIKASEKVLFSQFGEMLFTHFGVSGPIVLSASALINRKVMNNLTCFIDLKPALTNEVLDARLLREFKDNNLKTIANVMRSLLPKNLIAVVLKQASIKQSKNCSEITAQEREKLVFTLKNLKFLPKKLRPIDEAIVTAGGVDVKEINPKTMESKKVKGLYFAGEVLDIDAFTGGFNMQLAFSTGFVAGNNA